MDFFAKEGEALGHSKDRIDEFITIGKNSLQELYEQRNMLKVSFFNLYVALFNL
jgi:hypothetical protein